MKNTYLYQIFKFSFISFLFVYTLSSCEDKCKDTICENGFCVKGDCFCSDGYSGINCEIKESDKFVGNYEGIQTCFGFPQTLNMQISNFADNPWNINISLDNNNGIVFDLRGYVKNDSLFIENQFIEILDPFEEPPIINLIYPSNGILIEDSFLNFDLTYKGDVKVTCSIEMEKK